MGAVPPNYADLAQLVERQIVDLNVSGSNPLVCTKFRFALNSSISYNASVVKMVDTTGSELVAY